MFSIVELIRRKRNGFSLTEDGIRYFVNSAAKNTISESQIGAMLMAIFLNGMNDDETLWLTKAVIDSGEILSWDTDAADKHSTGGVGDKVSIALAPALAACGLTVPMVSGRGLDFTGGTLDKLESIPGYRTKLSVEEMKHCIATCNYFIAGSTETLCPGDRTLYRIRDITATVDCAPLIIASILGKKYAEGAKYLVLDLKVGSSAICKRTRDAEQLASKMLTVAEHLGMKLKVVLTKMETPIGKAVGNSLEVAESVQILKGGGPPSVKSLITRLGGELLFLTGKARSHVDGMRQVQAVLDNGKALEYFEKCLVCQGVDPETVKKLTEDEPWEVIKRSDHYLAFKAPRTGWVKTIDGFSIAEVCRDLGGGRFKPDDKIDHSVGAMLNVGVGSEIEEGQEWIRIYYNNPLSEHNIKKISNSIIIGDEFLQEDLIIKVIPE